MGKPSVRISRLVSCWNTRSSLVQSRPPMLAKASFLAEKVQPSASRNIFWAICFGVQSA